MRLHVFTVQPNLLNETEARDTRTFNRKMLDALESVFLGRMDSDQASYSIGGTSVAKLAPDELQDQLDRFRYLVAREEAQEEIRKGNPNPFTIYARL